MRPALYVLLGVLSVPTVGLVGDIVTDGKFKSTKSSGAPLEVASPDMVANLNADMVDGVEGTNIYTKADVDALVAAAAAADSRRAFYVTIPRSPGPELLVQCRRAPYTVPLSSCGVAPFPCHSERARHSSP